MTQLKSKIKKAAVAGAAILLMTVSTAFISFSEKKVFPAPSGKYAVGTFSLEMGDTTRTNLFGKPAVQRRLLVQMYYPAAVRPKVPLDYTIHPSQMESDIAALYGIPTFLVKKLSRSKVYVGKHSEVLRGEGTFPLLIFSHGWNGSRFQNSFLLPELASQGYVIASIEHTYAASGTIFSDGSRGGVMPLDTLLFNEGFSDQVIKEWSADQQFVLDQLLAFNDKPDFPLYGVMDMKKVGVFGHSFGGATSATTLTEDTRFKAGINFDGFYFGQAYQKGFDQPFMELRADNKKTEEMTRSDLKKWEMTKEQYDWLLYEEWNKRLAGLARNGYTSYRIKKSNHMSFSDFSLMMPLKLITAPHAVKHHELIAKLTLSFFDWHLKGIPQPSFENERFVL